MEAHVMSADVRVKVQEIAAYHEAGHMVLAATQGLSLRTLGLRIDTADKGICYYFKPSDGSYMSLERRVIAAIGGFAANKYFRHKPKEWRCYEDAGEVWNLCTQMSKLSDDAPLPEVFEQTLGDRADKLVEQHNSAIECLAKDLLATDLTPREPVPDQWSDDPYERRMTGEVAAALLREHGIPQATSAR